MVRFRVFCLGILVSEMLKWIVENGFEYFVFGVMRNLKMLFAMIGKKFN